MLIEDAATFSTLGVPMYLYGFYVMIGAAFALCMLGILFRKNRFHKGSAALCGVLMLTIGFVLSRLLFVFFDGSMRHMITWKGLFYVVGGGYSMFGALIGACLGACLGGKLMKLPLGKVLDDAVCVLLMFVWFARLGEQHTEIGISRPLVGDVQKNLFITVGEYDSYLSTWLLEGLFALICAFVCLGDRRKKHPAGSTALLGMLLFGASQTVLESLRFDQHMKFSFVGVQQVLSVLLVAAVLIVLSVQAMKKGRGKKLAVFSYVYLVLMAACIVLLEFMIDRTTISRILLYAVYVALAAVPVWMGVKMRAAWEKE